VVIGFSGLQTLLLLVVEVNGYFFGMNPSLNSILLQQQASSVIISLESDQLVIIAIQ